MTDILERLREEIIAQAFADNRIASGMLAERLICERDDAAREIARLRKRVEELEGARDAFWVSG